MYGFYTATILTRGGIRITFKSCKLIRKKDTIDLNSANISVETRITCFYHQLTFNSLSKLAKYHFVNQ